MRCIMGMRIIIHHSKHFPMQSKSICTITTTNGFRRKQNGCRLRSIGKHPCVQLKHDTNVSRILGTYQDIFVFLLAPRCSSASNHYKSPEHFSYSGPGCGGDGESRTRVRKHFHRTFSERSQCFKISPPWPPINMLPCQLSRCSLRGTENSLQVFPYSRRRYHSLRVSCGRRASRLRRCRTMLLMRNCCYF